MAEKQKLTVEQIAEALKKPFPAEDIEWRIQQAGMYKEPKNGAVGWALVLAYVTNRAIMERLDEVFGIEGWENAYQFMPDGGIVCGITGILDGVERTKWDGADKTNIEATKGGLSNAMKRAGVQWGIGRYLYKLESNFVNIYTDKTKGTQTYWDKETKQRLYWAVPKLPSWALPEAK